MPDKRKMLALFKAYKEDDGEWEGLAEVKV